MLTAPGRAMETVRILFLSANPTDPLAGPHSRLDIDPEFRAIDAKIYASEGRELLRVIPCPAVRAEDLSQALYRHRPGVVHFGGHGAKDGAIYLLDADNQLRPVSTAALVNLFGAFRDSLRLVVFNACHSRPLAQAVAEQIDCAIGMRDEFGDDAAVLFAASFYQAVGFGASVAEAFHQARTALQLQGIPGDDIPELLARADVDPARLVLCRKEGGPAPRAERPAPETDGNMLFGAMAVFMGVLDRGKFTDACVTWATKMEGSLADVLVAGGALTDDDRALVDQCVRRKLRQHGGDVSATLAVVADGTVREAMRRSQVPEIKRSVDRLPPITPGAADPAAALAASSYAWVSLHREGALGQVWVGRDHGLHREVALKVIQPERAAHPEARKRFLKEARITGQLEHPNIVPVYAAARRPEDGQPFYVMRLLRGQTLERKIADYHEARKAGKADPTERRRLLGTFLSVCNAVAYAHSRGVLHRDLKPENVVLGDFGEVHLLDWGLAKVLDQAPGEGGAAAVTLSEEARHEATVEGQRTGTPSYMAPEQAANDLARVGPRTDVYGLGAVLFEVLTGRPPHEGEVGEDLYRRIAEEDAPSARSVEPSVPPALDAICGKALARDPQQRYPTAAALAEAVQRWLDEEPLAAYRAAVDYFKKLVDESPRSRAYRDGLARNLVNLGLVLSGMDRNDEAEHAFRAAIAYFEALADAHPRVPNYRADLATARVHRRNALQAAGRGAEAEEAGRAALADYQKLMRVSPDDEHYRSHVASLLSVLGEQPRPPEPPPDAPPEAGRGEPAERGMGPVLPGRDDDLLIGILALEAGYIDRHALSEAIRLRLSEPDGASMAALLADRFGVGPDQLAVLQGITANQPAPADPHATIAQSVEAQLRGIMRRPPDTPPEFQPTAEPSTAEPSELATLPPTAHPTESPFGLLPHGPRYRFSRAASVSNMARVYVAHDALLRRDVALKEIWSNEEGLDPVAFRRFLFEAEITARLDHPGVVPVHSMGYYANGLPFFVMRLVRGETLRRAARRAHGTDPPPAAGRDAEVRVLLRCFVAVCATITYAHARGIVHGDVKPENIMLDPQGETHVLDWGLARVTPVPEGAEPGPLRLTTAPPPYEEGRVYGTPHYMSPEQARGDNAAIGPASDIYNLGATLYTILTGRPPQQGPEGDDPRQIILRVRENLFLPPHEVRPDVPRPLEAICLKAMARRPEDRYPSATDLARDVERWLAGEPVSAYREPWLARALRRLGRR